jgi:arginase family enzyme
VKTVAVFFPFDLFGSPGTSTGAELLADAFREMLADNKRERVPTRARAYTGKVRVEELSLPAPADYGDWKTNARKTVRQSLERGDFLLWVTGNHLGALPVYEELGQETLVVQMDGHLDIYNLSDCTSELSHGNFLLHSAEALPGIINVGHRELLLRPDHVGKHYQAAYSASRAALEPAVVLDEVRRACRSAKRVFLDLDCDALDPAYFPALAHPLPFGLTPQILLQILEAAWSERVVGLAISEFLPARDREDHCLFTLMWLVEYILLKLYEPR